MEDLLGFVRAAGIFVCAMSIIGIILGLLGGGE